MADKQSRSSLLEWSSVAGVEWRIRREYSRRRQQFEVVIETRDHGGVEQGRDPGPWFVRERHVVASGETFGGRV